MRAALRIFSALFVCAGFQACWITKSVWVDYDWACSDEERKVRATARVDRLQLVEPGPRGLNGTMAICCSCTTEKDEDWTDCNFPTNTPGWIYVTMDREAWEKVRRLSMSATAGARVILFLDEKAGPAAPGRLSMDIPTAPDGIPTPSMTISKIRCTIGFRGAAEAPAHSVGEIRHDPGVPLWIWRESRDSIAKGHGLWWRILLTGPASVADLVLDVLVLTAGLATVMH